eukprot:364465_1
MSVKIALAQLRSEGGNIESNLKKLSNYARLASESNAQLIITPELYLTGYNVKPLTKLRDLSISIPTNYKYQSKMTSQSTIIDTIAHIAIKYNIDIVIGLPEFEYQITNTTKIYYNTAIWMNKHGIIISVYRKTHLWGKLEHSIFTPYPKINSGNQYEIIKSPFGKGINFGLLICYDVEFVEPSRILAIKGCNCILVLTGTPSNEGHIVNTIVPSRAVENSCFVVYTNFPKPGFCGGSTCVAPDGTKIANAGFRNESLAFATININKYKDIRERNNYLSDRRVELFDNILEKKERHISRSKL